MLIFEFYIVLTFQAILLKGKEGSNTYVFLEDEEGQRVALASLKPSNDSFRIELSFSAEDSPIKFHVEGPGEVHLSGYVNGEEDDDDDEELDDEEMAAYRRALGQEDSDDDEDDEEVNKAVEKAILKKANGAKGPVLNSFPFYNN